MIVCNYIYTTGKKFSEIDFVYGIVKNFGHYDWQP